MRQTIKMMTASCTAVVSPGVVAENSGDATAARFDTSRIAASEGITRTDTTMKGLDPAGNGVSTALEG